MIEPIMEFVIKSNNSDREFVFSNFDGNEFDFEIRGFSLRTSTSVYCYMGLDYLSALFEELGEIQKPWQGKKQWESLEGDLSLIVTSDSLGHVQFQADLSIFRGAGEETSASAGLITDFGTLSEISRNAKKFFQRG